MQDISSHTICVSVQVKNVEPVQEWCDKNIPEGCAPHITGREDTNGNYILNAWFQDKHNAALFRLFWDQGSKQTLMGTLTLVKEPPKGRHWKVEVDGRTVEDENELLDWVRNQSRGKAYYFRTNFRDKTGHAYSRPVRQKHFKDGYWMYTFWFVRQNDAALMKLLT